MSISIVEIRTIYKICPLTLWQQTDQSGIFSGAPVDAADGYIHFSTAGQVRNTAGRHFSGEDGLVLVAVDVSKLGSALRWEESRGGARFPHLYSPLNLEAVIWVKPLPLGSAGEHHFPELEE